MKNVKLISAAIVCAGLLSANIASAHDSANYRSNDCDQDRRSAATVGGFVGAGAGAAAGRALAAASVRPEGVILGTVVGAVVGAKVGKKTVACDTRDYTQGHGRSYGESYNYGNHGRRESNRNVRPGHHGGYHQGHHGHTGYSSGPSHYENNGWYVPSSQSYYGQERRVMHYNTPAPVYSAPAPQYYSAPTVQQWTTGPDYVPAPVQYAPQYVPAPQYLPAGPTPCGQWVCQR